MGKVHALLVGINQYDFAPLKGCINDTLSFKAYLEKRFSNGDEPHSLNLFSILHNEEATRDNIVAAFEGFEKSKDGDWCIFYFSGHGSRHESPEEFWTETDSQNESLVCFDSRRPGCRDLMDKELAFLIWEKSFGKKLNFLVITDCCHSGSNTRAFDVYEQNRGVDASHFSPLNIEEYFGYQKSIEGKSCYKESIVNGKRRVTLATAPHIHLAACRETQKAKELDIGGTIQGAFTYSLLRTLYESNSAATYSELESRIKIYVNSMTTEQTPVININNLAEGIRFTNFLSDFQNKAHNQFKLWYNAKHDLWQLDGGTIHSITPKDEVVIDGKSFSVLKSYTDHSVIRVSGTDLNKKTVYTVVIKRHPDTRLRMQCSSEVDQQGVLWLQEALVNAESYIELTDYQPQFIIRVAENDFLLSLPNTKEAILPSAGHSYTKSGAVHFVTCLIKFCKWQQLLMLQNAESPLQLNRDFEVRLYLLQHIGQYDDNDAAILLDDNSSIQLPYRKEGNTWYPSAFRVEIINKSNSIPQLWVNPILLQWDLAILPNFESFEVKSGVENATKVRFINSEGFVQETLVFIIPEEILNSKGSIKDYLKLLFSPTRISVSSYYQEGVNGGGLRNMEMNRVAAPTWATHTIEINITHPGCGEVRNIQEL